MNPSSLLRAQRERIVAAAALGPVLDLACGRGRNALVLAEWGVPVIGCDRNPDFLAALRHAARARALPLTGLRADLESAHGIPIRTGTCGAILVFRFLYRPLAEAIAEALAPGGLLVYETFTLDQRKLGYGPENTAFLLAPGELPQLFPRLEVLHHWEGTARGSEKPEAVAQLVARHP